MLLGAQRDLEQDDRLFREGSRGVPSVRQVAAIRRLRSLLAEQRVAAAAPMVIAADPLAQLAPGQGPTGCLCVSVLSFCDWVCLCVCVCCCVSMHVFVFLCEPA